MLILNWESKSQLAKNTKYIEYGNKYFYCNMINLSYDKCSCRHKYLHVTLKDLYVLWNQFPCPPPKSKHLLFQVNWSKKLGSKQGMKIMLRLAKRCNVETPNMYHHPGHLGSSLVIVGCETKCYSKISVFCCILFLFVLGIIISCILRTKHNIPKKNADVQAKKQPRDQIFLLCKKKLVKVFVRKKKDMSIIDNRTKYFEGSENTNGIGIQTQTFSSDLNSSLRSKPKLTCDKADLHIYEDIDEIKPTTMGEIFCEKVYYDNKHDNKEHLIPPLDKQTFQKSVKRGNPDTKYTHEGKKKKKGKHYHSFDRLHLMPNRKNAKYGNDITNTRNNMAIIGMDASLTVKKGSKYLDKRFCSMNRNKTIQQYATIKKSNTSTATKSNRKSVCIDYVETPIIFCV
ncbi:hypothetical protein KUTeg_013982 [Tegillarca granosa]|uniref:Uncharacterized protein n=1 Tax=Tegillarca granosa TaxID=220873 RepID=A0ABQ9EV94_TEGGR|nr:hypothetical protein KUTeg_013982 [Tegillarca granosa]